MIELDFQRYDSNGNCTGEMRFQPLPPVKLRWEFNTEAQMAIDSSLRVSFFFFSNRNKICLYEKIQMNYHVMVFARSLMN